MDYSVEVSAQEFFEVPKKLSIPVLGSGRVNLKVLSAKDLSPQKTGKNSLIYDEFAGGFLFGSFFFFSFH